MRWSSLLLICLVLFGGASSLLAQTDTTELKFTTEVLNKEQWNKKIKLRNSSRVFVLDDVRSVLSVGLGMEETSYNYYAALPVMLSVSYERKILSPSFSLRLDFISKIAPTQTAVFDYIHYRLINDSYFSEIRGRSRFWLNFSGRYYYNKRRRIKSGRSGNNPFGQFVKIELFSPLSFNREIERKWFAQGLANGALASIRERRFANTKNASLSLSWGVQQRIMKTFFIDFSIGAFIGELDTLLSTNLYELTTTFKLGYLIWQE